MVTFSIAVFLLLITPGPGVISTAGVGSGFGARPGAIYVAGLFIGTNLVAMAVVTGLAATLLSDPRIRTFLMVCSTAYLTYLAGRIAFAGAAVGIEAARRAPGVVGGILVQAVNPKAYVVNTALFTGFVIWPASPWAETALKFAIINAIWIPVHFLWLYAGITLRRLELAPPMLRAINVVMAAAMVTVVVLAALSGPQMEF